MKKLLVYLSFGILLLTYVEAEAISKRQCTSCDDSDYPICATNGTHWFLFKNECRLNTENINRGQTGGTQLKKTEIANCFKACDQVCTDEYAPICAKSVNALRTFRNRCVLDLINCKSGYMWVILHEGECPPTPLPPPEPCDPECPAFCPMEYDPICASFGDINQTFHNLCYLKANICTSKRAWEIRNSGDCLDPIPDCNQACPLIHSPLCATFNGENRTFSNECVLDAEICLTGNQWAILSSGECIDSAENCPTMCPELYDPVCASNNGELRTFPNTCFLNVESCTTGEEWNIEYNGQCSEPPSQCADACPFVFLPICATANGVTRTFGNQCLLDAEICRTGENWIVISNSECPTTTTPQPIPLTTMPPPIPQPIPPIIPPPIPPPIPYQPIPYQPVPPIPPPIMPPPILPPPLEPLPAIPQPPMSPPPMPPSNCPDACPAIYSPICAGLQGSQRTFSNGCELTTEICRTGLNWQILYDGPCDQDDPVANPPTTAICPAIFDPICATFNGELRTFPNQCVMDAEIASSNQAWQIVNQGQCPPPTTTTVPTGPCPRCSDIYQPVCGFSDGEQRTFSNECELMSENCYSSRQWVLIFDGACTDSEPPQSCPPNYDPVCATFNGVERTFSNECELNNEASSTNTPWTIISRSACNCPAVCPRIYSPICATNNGVSKTFNSICEMRMESCRTNTEWELVSELPCPLPPNVDCPRTCSLRYNPVCATNPGISRTFHNECFLRADICKTGNNWDTTQPGPCLRPTATLPLTHDPGLTIPPNAVQPQLLSVFRSCLRSSMGNSHSIPPPPPGGPLIDPIPSSMPPPPPPPPPASCQINQCSTQYDPVCAIYQGELRTFSNSCFLDNNICRTGENWQTVNNGPCQPPLQSSIY